MAAREICFKLFLQEALEAASRTFWTAGSNKPIRTAMMAITTSNSISVNAARVVYGRRSFMNEILDEEKEIVTKPGFPSSNAQAKGRGVSGFNINTTRPLSGVVILWSGVQGSKIENSTAQS